MFTFSAHKKLKDVIHGILIELAFLTQCLVYSTLKNQFAEEIDEIESTWFIAMGYKGLNEIGV